MLRPRSSARLSPPDLISRLVKLQHLLFLLRSCALNPMVPPLWILSSSLPRIQIDPLSCANCTPTNTVESVNLILILILPLILARNLATCARGKSDKSISSYSSLQISLLESANSGDDRILTSSTDTIILITLTPLPTLMSNLASSLTRIYPAFFHWMRW